MALKSPSRPWLSLQSDRASLVAAVAAVVRRWGRTAVLTPLAGPRGRGGPEAAAEPQTS